jgi:hypothetical protein
VSRGRAALLGCGIGYGVVYVLADDVVAAAMWSDYSRRDQAISELSGVGAPSQGFLAAMLPVFSLLLAGFGAGVWLAAGRSRALRWTGALLAVQGATGFAWLLFPMSSRETAASGGGVNDIGHGVLSGLAIVLILSQMALGATAIGGGFRRLTLVTAAAVVLGFGYVATTVAQVAAGEETPWMGLVERVAYGGWLVWMAALAVVLLRRGGERPPAATPDRSW